MSKNLVVKGGTFDVTQSTLIDPADSELLADLDEEDRKELDQGQISLAIISLRGKDAKDERGNIIAKEGDYKFYHRLIKDIPDVDGTKGLVHTYILRKETRVYFKENQPVCRSRDNVAGIGEPGGNCPQCPLIEWQEIDGRNVIPCIELINVLTYDWILGDYYITQWKRTGRYRFQDFVDLRKLEQKPFYFVKVHATSQYMKEAPFPHYQPKLEVIETLSREDRVKIKEARHCYSQMFMATVDSEDTEIASQETNNNGQAPIQTGDPVRNDVIKSIMELEHKIALADKTFRVDQLRLKVLDAVDLSDATDDGLVRYMELLRQYVAKSA